MVEILPAPRGLGLVAGGKIRRLLELLDKRGRKSGYRKIESEDLKEMGFAGIDEMASSIAEGKVSMSKIKTLKPWFALAPPRQGFKRSTKRLYTQKGILGPNKELIELVRVFI